MKKTQPVTDWSATTITVLSGILLLLLFYTIFSLFFLLHTNCHCKIGCKYKVIQLTITIHSIRVVLSILEFT